MLVCVTGPSQPISVSFHLLPALGRSCVTPFICLGLIPVLYTKTVTDSSTALAPREEIFSLQSCLPFSLAVTHAQSYVRELRVY